MARNGDEEADAGDSVPTLPPDALVSLDAEDDALDAEIVGPEDDTDDTEDDEGPEPPGGDDAGPSTASITTPGRTLAERRRLYRRRPNPARIAQEEVEVYRLCGAGYSVRRIAVELEMSVGTVMNRLRGAVARLPAEAVEAERHRSHLRHEWMIEALIRQVQAGEITLLEASPELRQWEGQRLRLLPGVLAPQRIDNTNGPRTPDDQAPPMEIAELVRQAQAQADEDEQAVRRRERD